jgi:hypothetical protein
MTKDARAARQGVGIQACQRVSAILYNGLSRYDRVLEEARQTSEQTPELRMAAWALPELIEATSKTGQTRVAAQALERLAAAPRDISAELKDTALAEADQRQAAIEAELDGDRATAKAVRSLADLLGTQKAALEADHARHEMARRDGRAPRRRGASPVRRAHPLARRVRE